MIEASTLAGQAAEAAAKQSLPNAQQQDVSRFQDVMSGNASIGTAIQPQSVDGSSVLQFVEPGKSVESSGLIDNLINQATKIDSNYHSLIDQMANRPNIADYFNSDSKVSASEDMLTYPNVPNDDLGADTGSGKYDSILNSMQENNQKALAYQADMNAWSMGFRMWSAGVEVVSSAASKVSQSFQTLFRASG